MKAGLIALGIIFLVVGAVLYYYPVQTIGAETGTVGTGGSDVRSSYATLSTPQQWSLALLISGTLLLLFGLIIPGTKSEPGIPGPMGPRGSQGRRAVRQRPAARRKARALPRGTTVRTTKTTVKSRR